MVEDYFGVTYTYWGMRSVLDRCHLHAVLPRPPGHAGRSGDPGRLTKRGLTVALVDGGVTPEDLVVFGDEQRITLHGTVS